MRTFKYGLLPFLILIGSIAGLVIVEPHISATLIICAIGAIMMWIGGTNEKYFLLGVVLVGKIVISLDSEWIENSTIKSEKEKQEKKKEKLIQLTQDQ